MEINLKELITFSIIKLLIYTKQDKRDNFSKFLALNTNMAAANYQNNSLLSSAVKTNR